MAKVHAWKPDFRYYEELVAVECSTEADFEKIFDALYTRELRTCPHEMFASEHVVVVPKEALKYLPISQVKNKTVELRHTMALNKEVVQELHRRFNAADEKKPHYYICGKGSSRICCRFLAPLSTVKAIEKELHLDEH